jgi:hypothetical protein
MDDLEFEEPTITDARAVQPHPRLAAAVIDLALRVRGTDRRSHRVAPALRKARAKGRPDIPVHRAGKHDRDAEQPAASPQVL